VHPGRQLDIKRATEKPAKTSQIVRWPNKHAKLTSTHSTAPANAISPASQCANIIVRLGLQPAGERQQTSTWNISFCDLTQKNWRSISFFSWLNKIEDFRLTFTRIVNRWLEYILHLLPPPLVIEGHAKNMGRFSGQSPCSQIGGEVEWNVELGVYCWGAVKRQCCHLIGGSPICLHKRESSHNITLQKIYLFKTECKCMGQTTHQKRQKLLGYFSPYIQSSLSYMWSEVISISATPIQPATINVLFIFIV
jgi:hypothetical protein